MNEIQETYGRMFRAGIVIFILLFCDKVLAVVKEIIVAQRFGISPALDVFNLTYALPNITVLIIGGAFASAFVPLYVEWMDRLPRPELQRHTLSILYASWIFFTVITAVGFLAAPIIVPLMGYGLDAGQKLLGIELERALIFLILIDGAGLILQALLHSRRQFFYLYLAPMFINICIIVLLVFGYGLGVHALVYGFLLGSLCRLMFMLVTVSFNQFSLFSRIRFEKSAISAFLVLALPLLGSELIANSNLLVDQIMATQLSPGALSTLRYAFRINDLPIQLVIISISKSILPYLSEEAMHGHRENLRNIYRDAIILVGLLCLPVSALVMLFSREMVALLFQRGAFDAQATLETAKSLVCYNLGLFFHSYTFINAAFFAAIRSTKTLLYMGFLTIVLNILNNFLFMHFIGVAGIALSTTVTMGIIATMFIALLKKKLEITDLSRVWNNLGRLAGAALAMFGLGYLLARGAMLLEMSQWIYFPAITVLLVPFYLILIFLFRTAEIDRLLSTFLEAVRPLGHSR
jgi:putative peptidoglycan lipid II flippase